MKEEPFEIFFFTFADGACPVKQFLDSLELKMKVRAYRLLEILSESGNELREPYSKHLDDGIFELRIKVSTDISRLLYFFYTGRKIIVTNGFIKKTQKTPRREIETAKTYRAMYEARQQRGKE